MLPVGARHVCGHHVSGQRAHRESVGRDVVHHEREHVLGLGRLEKHRPEGQLYRQIEGPERELEQHGGNVGIGCRRALQFHCHRIGFEYLLEADAVVIGVDRPQRLVPVQHVDQGRLQGGEIEFAAQRDGDRDVVDSRVRLESVEEPHPLLGQRQWHTFGPLLRHQRRSRVRRACGIDGRGEFGDGRCVEERPHIHCCAQFRVDSRDHAGRVERVSAEDEEVIVHADTVHPEHRLENCHQGRLGVGAWGTVFAYERGEIGRRQGFSVQLAAGVQREFVQHDEHRRHHVLGHAPTHRIRKAVVIDIGLGAHDIADELLTQLRLRVVGVNEYCSLGHLRLGEQRLLDLAEFDTEATQFDLEVGAADVLDLAIGASAHQVAGAVHPVPRLTERVGDESIGRQVRASEVSASELHAREIELSLDSPG
ncbi:hypothetical protein RN2511_010130 [Rhodococcus sp. NKCM2511]|nr:hypothetical protein RN2511_010130 [Rhodococcus sp. NKCM2511]